MNTFGHAVEATTNTTLKYIYHICMRANFGVHAPRESLYIVRDGSVMYDCTKGETRYAILYAFALHVIRPMDTFLRNPNMNVIIFFVLDRKM